jgi:hypothetical protein
MTEATASVTPGRKVPAIWLVPIVAALLGIGLVVYNYLNQGPTVTITLSTAEGIVPGKTKIKALNVELGVVGTVERSGRHLWPGFYPVGWLHQARGRYRLGGPQKVCRSGQSPGHASRFPRSAGLPEERESRVRQRW